MTTKQSTIAWFGVALGVIGLAVTYYNLWGTIH